MIEYSGYTETRNNKAGKDVRIPFVFYSREILTAAERIERATEIFKNFIANIVDYDPSRTGQYGDIIRIRFTSVSDVPSAADDPYSGVPLPEPHVGK